MDGGVPNTSFLCLPLHLCLVSTFMPFFFILHFKRDLYCLIAGKSKSHIFSSKRATLVV